MIQTFRVIVETYDGCRTIWYEKSRAKKACDNITNRVYNRLQGLNIKQISVQETPTPG